MPNNQSLTAEHRRHDRLLVARYAAGDAQLGQDHQARELVRRCSECAALAEDIKAISAAVAKLPAPPRPRDFRLTTEQADKLRGSRLDRWLRGITGSSWQTVRPVAAVALSLGLVMSVVGVLPIVGGAAPGSLDTFRNDVAAPQQPSQPAPAETGDGRTVMPPSAQPPKQPSPANAEINAGGGMEAFASPEPPADANVNNAYLKPTPAVEPQPDQTNQTQKAAAGGPGPLAPLLVSGLVVTFLALGILVLLYAARRRFHDPLLR